MRVLLAITILILLAFVILQTRPIQVTTFSDEHISVKPYQSPFGYVFEYSPNDNCIDDISDNWNPGCDKRKSVFL